MYQVFVKDFYDDILKKGGLLDRMDTSNLPTNHPCYSDARKKVPGTFTDETKGQIITEQVALRAKAYAFNMGGKETIKAKGIAKTTVKNQMSIEDYKKCLFNYSGEDYTPRREVISFRSYHHKVKTISVNKLALNRYDDKRFVMPDQIHTLAHGHYRIE